jgi:S-adenosylmethionine:tRNA ribosyltransferase-isomerase
VRRAPFYKKLGKEKRKKRRKKMKISEFDYDLPEERIAKFPLGERDGSRLLVWRGGLARRPGEISETRFVDIVSELPEGSLLMFNNTRVVRARLIMHRGSGARVEVLCLEPTEPADYERAFASRGGCEWLCMVGNLKRWKEGAVEVSTGGIHLRAWLVNGEEERVGGERRVRFEWDGGLTFGELLERLGRVPIPPYLGREEEAVDGTRYQTVYARVEGSVAAPTAGLHFTPELMERIDNESVTLHVGAGTFLPVKTEEALEHPMHTEHFEVTLAAVERMLERLSPPRQPIIAVGTTTVRTLESLSALGWRIAQSGTPGNPATGDPDLDRPVGQFEPYDIPAEFDGVAALKTLADWMRANNRDTIKASTRIMITPAGFRFRVVEGLVTNFHQPRSTLLLLIAAFTGSGNAHGGEIAHGELGGESNPIQEWKRIYDYALGHGFRFLSYGDSSLLLRSLG